MGVKDWCLSCFVGSFSKYFPQVFEWANEGSETAFQWQWESGMSFLLLARELPRLQTSPFAPSPFAFELESRGRMLVPILILTRREGKSCCVVQWKRNHWNFCAVQLLSRPIQLFMESNTMINCRSRWSIKSNFILIVHSAKKRWNMIQVWDEFHLGRKFCVKEILEKLMKQKRQSR